jgi:NAD(P)-dependent dehydrogenase (short-subunit alcohol dehydrogenase family)
MLLRKQVGSVEVMLCDLAEPDSVRAFATAFKSKHKSLHLLVNNAGIAGLPQ